MGDSKHSKALRLRKQGRSHFQIARELGCTLSEVRRYLDPKADAASYRWQHPEIVTWENASHADGPGLAAWLVEQGIRPGDDRRLERSIIRWRQNEERPSFARVDQVLCRFGRHPSELPDEVWRMGHRLSVYTGAQSAEAERLYATGLGLRGISKRLGVDMRTVARMLRDRGVAIRSRKAAHEMRYGKKKAA